MTTQEIATRISLLNEIRARGLSKMSVWTLTQPLCDNYMLLEEVLSDVNLKDDIELRRVYLFAIIFAYSPQKFAGFKMSRKLMRLLSDKTGMSVSLISHSAENCDFHFLHYEDYARRATNVVNIFL